jgi:hypothetical protein
MKDISSSLEEKIASCVLFRRQSPAFSAKEYVSQFDLDMKNSEKLHVCEVVRVTDDFKPTKAGNANMKQHHIKRRDIILSTIEEGLGKTNEYRSFVIEVTTQNKDIFRQELHKRYNELPEPKADTTKTKIWVADSFTVAASRVKEYEFLAFIGEETSTPAPAPRKEEEPDGKSTPPKDETPRKSTEEKPSPDPSPKAKRTGSTIESLTLGMA